MSNLANKFQQRRLSQPNAVFTCSSEMIGVAGWVPPTVVKSTEIEAKIRQINPLITFDIEKTTGVRERRVADDSISVVDMAVNACKKVFAQTDVTPGMVDLVIFSSVSRACREPATAVLICKELGIECAKAFDISNACLGFVDAWMTADAMIQSGRSRICLIVGSEKTSPTWNLAFDGIAKRDQDPHALLPGFTLGDGAAAMLVGPPIGQPGAMVAHAGMRESYGEYSDLCVIEDHTRPMITNARGLFAAALKHSPRLAIEVAERMGWKNDDIDLIIPHQASLKVMEQGGHLMKMSVDKVHVTLDRFGNMASVSVPYTLAEAIENGRAKAGDNVLILGYGSGLGLGVLALTVNG